MKKSRRMVLVALGACSLFLVLIIGALAKQPDTRNAWFWKSDRVERLVIEQTDAESASCKRKKSGVNVRKWRCKVVKPTGFTVVRIFKNGIVTTKAHAVPAFVIVPS